MQIQVLLRPLRVLSYVVLGGMAAALVYAAYIVLANWAAIAV